MKKGLIKGVISGDCVIISGKLSTKDELPKETILYLAGISCPKIGNQNKLEDEPFGFDSREFVRKLINGKVGKYQIDYTNKDKNYGQLIIDDLNVGLELMKNGLAKIGFIPKNNENLLSSDYYKSLHENEKQAKLKKIGLYSDNSNSKTGAFPLPTITWTPTISSVSWQ